jgi:hypothetical protein
MLGDGGYIVCSIMSGAVGGLRDGHGNSSGSSRPSTFACR